MTATSLCLQLVTTISGSSHLSGLSPKLPSRRISPPAPLHHVLPDLGSLMLPLSVLFPNIFNGQKQVLNKEPTTFSHSSLFNLQNPPKHFSVAISHETPFQTPNLFPDTLFYPQLSLPTTPQTSDQSVKPPVNLIFSCGTILSFFCGSPTSHLSFHPGNSLTTPLTTTFPVAFFAPPVEPF
ncbi:hypothetical protein L596_027952 [Steinernema carpocapsae]|uniref:Uncharacterized protein n=1 Tax=Steinernema carpocapsae TaxID=34508 RepID=A0A4U5LX13_STECR|nr:hypothetical protein L596_027952 [Steinernema carpocapsae]